MEAEADRPSPFLLRHRERLPPGPVLDVACGRGRHALALGRLARSVVALDRHAAFLGELAGLARRARLPVWCVRCDLEAGLGLPSRGGSAAGVLVFRFLHRPLCPDLAAALAPGGLLLYETFTTAQRELGRGPRNPDFLLAPGELPDLFPDLEVLEHEEGVFDTGGARPAAVARLLARRRG